MARKKPGRSPISSNRNGPLKSSLDPKFHYECFVRLENCDFPKHSNAMPLKSSLDPKFHCECFVRLENCDFPKHSNAIPRTDLSQGSIDNRNSVPVENSKTLNNVSMHHNKIINESICKPVGKEQERNSSEKFQRNEELFHTNRNIVQHKNFGVKFSDTLKKSNADTLALVAGKSLRPRKKVNYMERKSIGTPEASNNVSQVESKRIPVYRKEVIVSPKSRKRKVDLYDFIPESEEDKDSDVSYRIDISAKKRKINHPAHTRNKITHERLRHRKLNKRVEISKYHKKIDRIMDKFTKKLRSKHESDNSLQINIVSRKQNTRKDLIENDNKRYSDSVFNSTMLPESRRIVFLDESIITKGLTEHISEIDILRTREINETNKHVSIPSNENFSLDTGQVSPSNSAYFESPENMSIRSSSEDNLENLFGFADDMEENDDGGKASNKINVLQNIILNRSSSSKQYISTPKRFQVEKSWRFDTKFVNRNPHFLAVKKNSLPALNQDPVLDHTFDERIGVVNKMVLVPNNKKSTRQQSILNYIEVTKEYSDYHDHSQSLYDAAELSPIKYKEANKENAVEKKKLSNENQSPRRNILGLITGENVTNHSSKTNEELIKQKNDMKENCETFGFDCTSEIIEDENVDEQRAKPFRIEVTYKKYNKIKKQPETIDKPVRDSEVRRLIEEDPGFEEVVDKDGLDCGELGLFEDIEVSPNHSKSYKITKKKIRDPNTNKNKEPKVKLTKEAQKWIKQFNEMCDEIENEELEIE